MVPEPRMPISTRIECDACGATNPSIARYCRRCGQRIVDLVSAPRRVGGRAYFGGMFLFFVPGLVTGLLGIHVPLVMAIFLGTVLFVVWQMRALEHAR